MNGLSCSIPLPQYHEVEADGHTYLIDGRVTVQFNWVDFGIGAYEFWGRTGYDSSFGPEDTVITDVEIDDISDETGDEPETYSKEAIVKALNEMLLPDTKFDDWINERCQPEEEDPYDGMDHY